MTTSLETAISRTFQYLSVKFPKTEDWSKFEAHLEQTLQGLGVVADVRAELRSTDETVEKQVEETLSIYQTVLHETEEEARTSGQEIAYMDDSAQHFAQFIHETWPHNKQRLHAVKQLASFYEKTRFPAIAIETLMTKRIKELNAAEPACTPTP